VAQPERVFGGGRHFERRFTRADGLVLAVVAITLYAGARLAFYAPKVVEGPDIVPAPAALPIYAIFSTERMLAAYALSFVFTLFYGYFAASNRRAESVLIPLLDVLQSVPILSFLPVVLLSLTAILPEGPAVELASIVLIFTSQAWNLTFAWYQSLTTIPKELREASSIFRFNHPDGHSQHRGSRVHGRPHRGNGQGAGPCCLPA
jgi:NitT/TauT family transport system permease protein